MPIAMLALLVLPALADEGMWLPEQLPMLDQRLQDAGLQIDAAVLADPQQAPLGAIVSLGFCSAAFLSDDGLLGTNHHCVGGFLQHNSSAEADRGHDGYLAPDRAGELPVGPGGRLTIVESIEDVTDAVVAGTSRRTKDAQRANRMAENRKRLVAGCESDDDHSCIVVPYYGGQTWSLVRRRVLRDVRIVYAPPESVGSFGGEIDNWMWPRHSGDFALLRAYVAPDGSTADYSPDNVPYTPTHTLKIDPTGAAPGDFVMVAGYPGGTYRYRTADTMEHAWRHGYPDRISLYDDALAILREESARDPEAAARLANPIDRLSNSRKYAQGMLDGFDDGALLARKRSAEAGVDAWVDADKARKRTFASPLEALRAIEADEHADSDVAMLVSWMTRLSDPLSAANLAWRWAGEAEKADLQREEGLQERDRPRLERRMKRIDASLWLPSDRRLLELAMTRVMALPQERQPTPVTQWISDQGGVESALDRLYAATALTQSDTRLALLSEDRETLAARADPWIELAAALEAWKSPRREIDKAHEGARLRIEPLRMQAMRSSQAGPVYPDANGTLRITYGHVRGYSPADAIDYRPQTTVAGVVAKVGEAPFDAPQRLRDAARTSTRSRWVDPALGDVPVDFLTTLDTTGGNSGSATLNAKGELVGFIFDGNYEAMSADWHFDPAVTRSIHVDIRYVLWTLESVEAAHWVVEELGLAE